MKESSKSFSWTICIVVFVAVALFYAAALIEIQPIAEAIVSDFPDKNNVLEKYGVIGDSTALVNTLFSALAFGGVIVTLVWQLKTNRKQAEQNRISAFENVYFNMIQTFESMVEGLSVTISLEAEVGDSEIG